MTEARMKEFEIKKSASGEWGRRGVNQNRCIVGTGTRWARVLRIKLGTA